MRMTTLIILTLAVDVHAQTSLGNFSWTAELRVTAASGEFARRGITTGDTLTITGSGLDVSESWTENGALRYYTRSAIGSGEIQHEGSAFSGTSGLVTREQVRMLADPITSGTLSLSVRDAEARTLLMTLIFSEPVSFPAASFPDWLSYDDSAPSIFTGTAFRYSFDLQTGDVMFGKVASLHIVPEPGTWVLTLAGVGCLALMPASRKSAARKGRGRKVLGCKRGLLRVSQPLR